MESDRNESMQGAPDTGAGAANAGRAGGERVKERAQRLAGEAKDQINDQVQSGFDSGKRQAVDTIEGIAHALLQGAGDDRGAATPYVRRAGEQLQRVSDYLKNTDMRDIVAQTEGFARRQPTVFLGSAFALGIVAARFIKSGRPQREAYDAGDTRDLTSRPSREGLGTEGFGNEGFGDERFADRERPVASYQERSTQGMQGDALGMGPGTGEANVVPPTFGASETSDVNTGEGSETISTAGRDLTDVNPTAPSDTLHLGTTSPTKPSSRKGGNR